jgi:hypothetical protein
MYNTVILVFVQAEKLSQLKGQLADLDLQNFSDDDADHEDDNKMLRNSEDASTAQEYSSYQELPLDHRIIFSQMSISANTTCNKFQPSSIQKQRGSLQKSRLAEPFKALCKGTCAGHKHVHVCEQHTKRSESGGESKQARRRHIELHVWPQIIRHLHSQLQHQVPPTFETIYIYIYIYIYISRVLSVHTSNICS